MCKMIGREQPAQRITYPVVAKGFSAYDIVERATSEVRGFSFSWKQSTSLRCSKLAPNRAMRIHDQHGAERGSAKQRAVATVRRSHRAVPGPQRDDHAAGGLGAHADSGGKISLFAEKHDRMFTKDEAPIPRRT
jgi:hypothetical protein